MGILSDCLHLGSFVVQSLYPLKFMWTPIPSEYCCVTAITCFAPLLWTTTTGWAMLIFLMLCSFDEGKASTVSAGGRDFEVTPDLLDIKLEEQKLSGRFDPKWW